MSSNPSIASLLRSIAQTYEQIKAALNEKLSTQGYEIIKEEYNREVFGSRYVIWSKATAAIRLIWDGRDEWFVLQVADSKPSADWEEVIHIPYDPKIHDLEYANSLPQRIVKSLK